MNIIHRNEEVFCVSFLCLIMSQVANSFRFVVSFTNQTRCALWTAHTGLPTKPVCQFGFPFGHLPTSLVPLRCDHPSTWTLRRKPLHQPVLGPTKFPCNNKRKSKIKRYKSQPRARQHSLVSRPLVADRIGALTTDPLKVVQEFHELS